MKTCFRQASQMKGRALEVMLSPNGTDSVSRTSLI